MAISRATASTRMVWLTDRLRWAPGLELRDSRATPDGIEAVVVDRATGQLALLTLSPINQGECPGCGHAAHNEQDRCEAIATVTKRRCECWSVYGRFPAEDRTQEQLDGKTPPTWLARERARSARA